MKKYLSIFKISFQQEFAFKANFIMWRVRNIMQFFLIFFLWDTVFTNSSQHIFGYDRAKILTYVFGLLVVRAIVLSSRAIDVSGEVSRGDLSNYLLKPFSYFKYWLTRDFSSKLLNIIFSIVEITVLFLILRPPFYLQTNLFTLLGFLVLLILAIVLYFCLILITGAVPLWIPEAGWGASFLVTAIFTEFLSGSLFPLDIFPTNIQQIINLTPFPYLVFYPLQIYLGKITGVGILKTILISSIWAGILWITMSAIWKKGLKAYQSHGR